MTATYTYEETLATSERIHWRVEDLIGGERRLDFSLPFLPEALACAEELDFLSTDEKRTLNQIRANGYLYLFGLVEEFILPFVVDHARHESGEDHTKTRALLQFAAEEAKHIELFRRFQKEFERGFGTRCDLIGPPSAIASAVLAHQPLAVALTILHIEWMTQRHWQDCARDDRGIDPMFKDLLKHHWMEEAQHARLDTLMVAELGAGKTPEQLAAAVDEYLEIGGMLDAGLAQQVSFDLDAFLRATGRRLNEAEAERFREVQQRANRWTFLGSGMSHPEFLGSVERLDPALRRKLEEVAPAFC